MMPVAATANEPDFLEVIQKTAQLATISSEAEALSLFSSQLMPLLRLADSKELGIALSTPAHGGKTDGRQPSTRSASEPAGTAVRLTAELAAWRLARLIKEAADARDAAKLQAVLGQSDPQQGWLLADRQSLRQAVRLAEVLSAMGIVRDRPGSRLDPDYAAYLDGTYPRLTGSDSSWLALAEREGYAGIRRRFHEFWEQPRMQQKEPELARNLQDADKDLQASHYFSTRVLPVVTAQIIAAAIHAESTAEQRVRKEWASLRHWGETLREKKGLARLCGTWQWIVHNHQNHQEHKMMMQFDPPEAPDSSKPRPAKIVVLGDSVYLRWEFQAGYQEDSLLFAGEGQRLEGTFVNSAGAWGSIAGKRIAPCSGS
jgi:hypothetical protein